MNSLTMRSALLALLATPLAPAPALAQPAAAATTRQALADADPAVFAIRDADTTIYLFGTFHLLDADTKWFDDEVRAAFNASSRLMLEIANDGDMTKMAAEIAKRAMADPGTPPLSTRLSAPARAALLARLAEAKLPLAGIDKLRPAMVSILLVQLAAAKEELAAANAVDTAIAKAAAARKMPVSGFESVDDQIDLFVSKPDAVQLKELEEQLLDKSDSKAALLAMRAAWASGDPRAMAALMKEMKARTPAAYASIFADRNAKWATRLKAELATPGTMFVAVGSGHLAGPDSVQQYLKQLGIKTRRVVLAPRR